MEQFLFYLLSFLLLTAALIVVTVKNLVRSIFMFFVVLFALAGLYVFASADFIAVAQVIIYVGGVLVLMLFAFLLSNRELLAKLQLPRKFINLHVVPGLLTALMLLFIIVSAVLNAGVDNMEWLNAGTQGRIGASDNTIHNIGISMMTRYILPFEAISIFLLMALIGAAHMARKEKNT
jgi:NADH-quinone oxidoreductase subunit J